MSKMDENDLGAEEEEVQAIQNMELLTFEVTTCSCASGFVCFLFTSLFSVQTVAGNLVFSISGETGQH